MTDTAQVEDGQQRAYPGLTVRRDGDAIVVRIPVRFYRRNGRQMVLARGSGRAEPERETNGALVAAIAKAYRWQEQLESGEYATMEELAAANGVDRTYAARLLRLTFLAPELVEAILAGDEPDGMSLRKLLKGVPVSWDAQRKQWPPRSRADRPAGRHGL